MDARICLLVVAIINLSNFSLGITILSDIVFQCKPKTFTFHRFIWSSWNNSFTSLELDFYSRRFIDISLNLDLLVSYNRLASSLLFTPVIRFSVYMSLWMLHSSVPFPFPRWYFYQMALLWSGKWWYWSVLLANWDLSATGILWHLFLLVLAQFQDQSTVFRHMILLHTFKASIL